MYVTRREVLGILSILIVVAGLLWGAPLEARIPSDSILEAKESTDFSRGIMNVGLGMVVAGPMNIEATHNQTNLHADFSRSLLNRIKRGSARTTGALLSLLPGLGPRLELRPVPNAPNSRDPLPEDPFRIDVNTKERMPRIQTPSGFTHSRAWF